MKSPRILVVDDEPRAVELLVRTLRKEARLDTAASANEAWEKVQAGDFDLVISDQRMPGMSGIDLLSRIAEVDAHVGRILLTAGMVLTVFTNLVILPALLKLRRLRS